MIRTVLAVLVAVALALAPAAWVASLPGCSGSQSGAPQRPWEDDASIAINLQAHGLHLVDVGIDARFSTEFNAALADPHGDPRAVLRRYQAVRISLLVSHQSLLDAEHLLDTWRAAHTAQNRCALGVLLRRTGVHTADLEATLRAAGQEVPTQFASAAPLVTSILAGMVGDCAAAADGGV